MTTSSNETYFDLLPEDLVNRIYEMTHRLRMRDVGTEIRDRKDSQHFDATCLLTYLENLRESECPVETIRDMFTLVIHLYLDDAIDFREFGRSIRNCTFNARRLLWDSSVYSDADLFDLFKEVHTMVTTSNRSLKQVLDVHEKYITEAVYAHERSCEWVADNVR